MTDSASGVEPSATRFAETGADMTDRTRFIGIDVSWRTRRVLETLATIGALGNVMPLAHYTRWSIWAWVTVSIAMLARLAWEHSHKAR